MFKRKICIIPARGGSKRLPRKNIIEFKGKPIIAYTIKAALESKLFDSVVVSTEDKEIKNVSLDYGAEIDNRSKNLATDSSRVVDVCINYLEKKKEKGLNFDLLCCLYPTAPLRNSEDIKVATKFLTKGKYKSVMAVTELGYPVHQALKIIGKHMKPMWPELISSRSSDLSKLYIDNGSTYVVGVDDFIKKRTFYNEPLKGYIMPKERSIDIDNSFDLDLAKYFYSKVNN